jgi:hypothetical protein
MTLRAWCVAALLVASSAASGAQNSALRVVVIEGEDGVNIIQQKTAVRPVVEVRDRNNLPVSGAIVTFSIEGGKAATFGGASTLTVATNAAGQAAVTGLTPSAAGAFQIQVSAAFQGQVATATIAQTNVMTAAQAVAAGAASGSGSASGGGAGGSAAGGAGGGLSTTTIAIAGAAIAGGAVAATQIADKLGETNFTGTFSGTISGVLTSRGDNCSFTYTITGSNARLKFDQFSDSSVAGKFDYEGPSGLTSTTCSVITPPIPSFIGEVPLTGTPSNFGGRNTITAPGAGNVSGENTYIFQGSINGSTATGTFTYEQRSTNPVDNINVTASGTFPITFTKQ